MGNSLKLYRTILEMIWETGVRFHDLRCLMTYAWAIVGLLMSHSIHLGSWAMHRIGSAKAASKERQLSRWLHNDKIKPGALYRTLIKAALIDWAGERIYLAMDSSVLWDRFVIVRIALVYRGRSLPLSWVVLPSQSASVAFEDYQIILEQANLVLPEDCQATLLADRGFVDNRLFCLARDFGWGFRIRLKGSIKVHRAGKPTTKVSRLMPAKGQALFLHKVWLTDRKFGPVHLALAHVQTTNGYEQWSILSDDPTDLHTFDEYGLRFDIEENFLDDKSAGFQLESSEIRTAQALSRLCLVLATATLYLASNGVITVTLGLRRFVDAHWSRGLSYFKIGWRWIHFALTQGIRLLPFLWFDPSPDQDLVFASKRQASTPVAGLSALRLEVT